VGCGCGWSSTDQSPHMSPVISHREFNPPLRGGHDPPKAFCGSHPHCSEPLGLCNVNAMIDPSTGPPYPNTHIATGGVQEEMEVWTVEQEEIGGGKHTGRTAHCLDTGSALRLRMPCECDCVCLATAYHALRMRLRMPCEWVCVRVACLHCTNADAVTRLLIRRDAHYHA